MVHVELGKLCSSLIFLVLGKPCSQYTVSVSYQGWHHLFLGRQVPFLLINLNMHLTNIFYSKKVLKQKHGEKEKRVKIKTIG